MIAIADDQNLYLLDFIDRPNLEQAVEQLRLKLHANIIPGLNSPIKSIEDEIQSYFERTLTEFKTPMSTIGSPFQRAVWQALLRIPYGTTISYAELAANIKQPTAYRAVANANGANRIVIAIPCHRVINSNGGLGGYGGGIERKQLLLEHENMPVII